MGQIGDFLSRLLGGVFVLVTVGVFIRVVGNTVLAPEPGDPFYLAWAFATQYGWQALVLIVPGAAGATYVILQILDSGDF